MKKLVELAKKFYASTTGYRLVWTSIQAGAGILVVALGAHPTVGVAVTLLTTFVTSVARQRLEARREETLL